LVRAFAEETSRRGGYVVAADVDPLAPALYLADQSVEVPRTEARGYVDRLFGLVAEHKVGLIVPTIDTDLRVLAATEAAFAEQACVVAISSPAFVETTLDKPTAVEAFGRAGVSVPRSWVPRIDRPVDLPSRLVVKPRRGSASQHVYRTGPADLDIVLRLVPDPVIQEELDGPEITIDALLDLGGRPVHYVPRRRIRTLGGESIQGVTLDHDGALEDWIEGVLEVCAAMGGRGPLTIQAFLTARGPVLTEVNPRFGGGFPLALAAGARYPSWLLDMVEGRPVPSRLREYETGLYMTRYNVELFTRQPKW
jgi:carbamoyl-phosphate synthase large subunit